MKTKNILWVLLGTGLLLAFMVKNDYRVSGNKFLHAVTDTLIHDTIYLVSPENPAPCPSSSLDLIIGEWMLDEVDRSDENGNSRYVRGNENSTNIDYNKLRLLFLRNGSGKYTDISGNDHEMKWEFVPGKEMDVNLYIDGPKGETFIWHNVIISNDYLFSTCPYRNLLLSSRYVKVR